MTNRIALVLGVILLSALCLDLFQNEGAGFLFMARKFAELIEYIAFWR